MRHPTCDPFVQTQRERLREGRHRRGDSERLRSVYFKATLNQDLETLEKK